MRCRRNNRQGNDLLEEDRDYVHFHIQLEAAMVEAAEHMDSKPRSLLHMVVDDAAATAMVMVVLHMLELARREIHILEDFDRHHRSSLVAP